MNNQNSTNLNLKSYSIHWNNSYPFDYLWRKKYNVAFGEERHLKMNFIDMKIDLIEDKLYNKMLSEALRDKKVNPERLLRKRVVKDDFSEEETDSMFDEIMNNLDKFADDYTTI